MHVEGGDAGLGLKGLGILVDGQVGLWGLRAWLGDLEAWGLVTDSVDWKPIRTTSPSWHSAVP